MRSTLAILLALLLALPAGTRAADEADADSEYLTLSWEENTPLVQIMDFVKAAMDAAPKFRTGGQVKGFVFPTKFKEVRLNFSSRLQVPVPKGATLDQRAEVLLRLFNTLLEISEFALVDRGSVYEIVEGAKRVKKPVRIITQEEAIALPPDDVLVTLLYTFKHFDPGKVTAVLGDFLNASAGEKTNHIIDTRTIILTALSSKIREIYKLLDLVDANAPEMSIFFVPLSHASATEIEPTISQIIKAREVSGSRGALAAGQRTQAQILPNPRTNKELILLATPNDAGEIRKLIEKLDTELAYGKASVRFFQIKHRSASEVKKIIDDLYAQRREITAPPPGANRPPQGLPGQGTGQPFPENTPLSEEARSLFIAPRIVADDRSLTAALAAGGAGSASPSGTTSPVDTPSGGTNMLIVIAPSERVLTEVEEIINQVDRRKPLVLIEATVMELGPDASREIGVELAGGDRPRDNSVRAGGATSFGISTPNFSTSPPTRTPSGATGLTAFLFKDSANRIPFIIRLQETDSLTDVLACPKLLANDNETATFNISRQEPYQRQETTSGGVITTAQAFEKAETELEFTPSISTEAEPVRMETGELLKDENGKIVYEERKYVRMKVRQRIESFKGAATFAGGTPPKESREAATTVTILDKSTVAIGGFTSKNKRKTTSKVPFLGDIPLLGFFFRDESESDTMTTLFIFITPHIVDDLRSLEDLPEAFRTPEKIEELKRKYKGHFPDAAFEDAKDVKKDRPAPDAPAPAK